MKNPLSDKPTRWLYKKDTPIYSSDDFSEMEKYFWDRIPEVKHKCSDGTVYFKKFQEMLFITKIELPEDNHLEEREPHEQ